MQNSRVEKSAKLECFFKQKTFKILANAKFPISTELVYSTLYAFIKCNEIKNLNSMLTILSIVKT